MEYDVDECEASVDGFDEKMVFSVVIFQCTEIFSQSQSTSNLILNLTMERGCTSNEKLWNHLFISTRPPVAFALRSIPAIKLST